jgi:hypothetical protein
LRGVANSVVNYLLRFLCRFVNFLVLQIGMSLDECSSSLKCSGTIFIQFRMISRVVLSVSSVLLVKETGVPGEVTDKLYHNVVCSTSRHELVAHVVANPTTIRLISRVVLSVSSI